MEQEDLSLALKERFFVLKKQREAALKTASDILEEMKRVRTAYRALSGEASEELEAPKESQSPGQRSGRKKRVGKRTLSGPEVSEALYELLDKGPLPEDDVKRQLGELALDRGLSRKGLHFVVMAELKKTSLFKSDGNAWALDTTNGGTQALEFRIRQILRQKGPLTEPKLCAQLKETGVNGDVKDLMTKALRSGPFAFNGAAWEIVSR